MSDILFRSDISLELVQHVGTDRDILYAARAISPAKNYGPTLADDTSEACRRTLGACMRLKHNSPFEHGLLSVYVEAPGVVWWQLTRQRFMSLDSEDFAFNLDSGRYKHLKPEFYLPPPERPMVEPVGFKPMRPIHEQSEDARLAFIDYQKHNCLCAWENYKIQIERGVAREVARMMLPNWALYCNGYVTGKPLTWLQFLSKRRRTAGTAVATFPQWEIENFAEQCEVLFAERWPITYAAFIECGRIAP